MFPFLLLTQPGSGRLPGHFYAFGHFGWGRVDVAVVLAVGEVKDQAD